jgi:hypothetical protein
MKIGCYCGGVIYDQTDCLPTKAYFVADEDYFDMMDKMDEAIGILVKTIKSGISHEEWRQKIYGEKAKDVPSATPEGFASSAIRGALIRHNRHLYYGSLAQGRSTLLA